MEFLLDGLRAVTPTQFVLSFIGALLIYLSFKKDYAPSLLLPLDFVTILVHLTISCRLTLLAHG